MHPRKTRRIYLAAPLFCDAERSYNNWVRDRLLQAGYEVYLPQEHGDDVHHRTTSDDRVIFERHRHALDHVDVVIAVCDGSDADSGTAWEAGYAFAREIPVIVLRTDYRMIGPERRINLMLEQSSFVEISIDHVLNRLSMFP